MNLLSYPLNPSPSPFSRTRHTRTSPTVFAIVNGWGNKVLGTKGVEGADEPVGEMSGVKGNGNGGSSEGSKSGEVNCERFRCR